MTYGLVIIVVFVETCYRKDVICLLASNRLIVSELRLIILIGFVILIFNKIYSIK
jgi:hypothetical protein